MKVCGFFQPFQKAYFSVTVLNCPRVIYFPPGQSYSLKSTVARPVLFLIITETASRHSPGSSSTHNAPLFHLGGCSVTCQSTVRAPAWRLRREQPTAIFLRGSGDERKFLGAPLPSVCSSGQNGEDCQDSRRY